MRVLIVKSSSLGDIIQAFSVLEYLKGKNAQVDWVVEKPHADIVTAHPLVNRGLCLNTKKWRKAPLASLGEVRQFRSKLQEEKYDVVFDLQGNIKSGLITLLSRSPYKVGFGKETVPEKPNTWTTNLRYNPPSGQNIREDYLYLVRSYFKDEAPLPEMLPMRLQISEEQENQVLDILADQRLQNRPSMMVCPGSAWPNKQLDRIALEDFLKKVQQEYGYAYLFIWGSEVERRVSQELHETFTDSSILVDRLTLPVLQNLMDRITYVLAVDSLPLHLAGTTTTPTFSFFGASSAKKYCPIGSQHRYLQGTCPYNKMFEKRCPILRTCSTGDCIKQLKGDELFDAFNKIYDKVK